MGDRWEKGDGATRIELKGTWTMAINQSGLNYNDLDEREEALNDFKMLLYEWEKKIGNYVIIHYDEKDIEVSDGEY